MYARVCVWRCWLVRRESTLNTSVPFCDTETRCQRGVGCSRMREGSSAGVYPRSAAGSAGQLAISGGHYFFQAPALEPCSWFLQRVRTQPPCLWEATHTAIRSMYSGVSWRSTAGATLSDVAVGPASIERIFQSGCPHRSRSDLSASARRPCFRHMARINHRPTTKPLREGRATPQAARVLRVRLRFRTDGVAASSSTLCMYTLAFAFAK